MLEELETTMEEVAKHSNHKGYWYKLEDVLIVMVCGVLCSLETLEKHMPMSRIVKQNLFEIDALIRFIAYFEDFGKLECRDIL